MQDFDDCLTLIDSTLAETRDPAEYAVYVKALIYRQKGAFACICIAATRTNAQPISTKQSLVTWQASYQTLCVSSSRLL